jgi:hypothetical protein
MIKKNDRKGFYCASDSVYFNLHSQALFKSIRIHAPWAHCHAHIWDANPQDRNWCEQMGVSFSESITPSEYVTAEQRRGYWVCARFALIPELYSDDVPVIALDADSIFRKHVTEKEYDCDVEFSWSANREYKNLPFRAQGSSAAFAAHHSARHQLRQKLQDHQPWRWHLDEELLDEMVAQGLMKSNTMKYGDYKMRSISPVWTGKGDRKNQLIFKPVQQHYKNIKL